MLSPVLDSHSPAAIITHAFLLPQLLELIYDSADRHTQHIIILVGDPSTQAMASVASNVKVLGFADLEREGFKVEKILSPLPSLHPSFQKLIPPANYEMIEPADVFTVSFYESESGQVHGAQLTHENITAGVAAIRALFPLSNALSPLDTVLSGHSMSTPYGRAIAYTAIYEGTSFASIPTSELYHSDERQSAPFSSFFYNSKRGL